MGLSMPTLEEQLAQGIIRISDYLENSLYEHVKENDPYNYTYFGKDFTEEQLAKALKHYQDKLERIKQGESDFFERSDEDIQEEINKQHRISEEAHHIELHQKTNQLKTLKDAYNQIESFGYHDGSRPYYIRGHYVTTALKRLNDEMQKIDLNTLHFEQPRKVSLGEYKSTVQQNFKEAIHETKYVIETIEQSGSEHYRKIRQALASIKVNFK